MWRTLFAALLVVASAYLIVWVAGADVRNLAVEPARQPAAAVQAIATSSEDFNETGILVFYPNNVGPVPYLLYQNPNGRTLSKALTFPAAPPDALSSWAGARVSVTGHLKYEHVVVSRITHILPP